MISAIVAVDNNWGIGYNGDLLEHIPEDLKYFKALTTGHVLIMGRKTWDSLPEKPLPHRHNVIISNSLPETPLPQIITNMEIPVTVMKMDTLISGIPNMRRYLKEDIFIVGGGEIYKQLLPYCDCVYVTKIYKDHENVDTYFPDLDKSEEWVPTVRGQLLTHNDLTYQFWQYDRIS